MLASSCLPLTATRPPAPAQEHDKGKQAFDDVSFRCPFERIAKHLSDFVDDGDFVQQCKEVYYEVLFPSPPYPYKTGAPLSPPPLQPRGEPPFAHSPLFESCQCFLHLASATRCATAASPRLLVCPFVSELRTVGGVAVCTVSARLRN